MKVFLSWSKERSRAVAAALKSWLTKPLQNCEPWMSDTDVLAGQRWGAELTRRLDESTIGILCVTPENYLEPWLNFEAGAISKKVGADSQIHVAPYLLGFERPEDLPPPLGQFQSKIAKKEGTFELLKMINRASEKQLAESDLREQFEMWWPKLEHELKRISKLPGGSLVRRRPDGEKLDELLSLTRTLVGRFESMLFRGVSESIQAEVMDAQLGVDARRLTSSAESFLYAALQYRPSTKDLFTPNERIAVADGERPVEVDLVCHELKLVVEIDGYHHFRSADAFRRDRHKDIVLQRSGYFVVRVLADDVVARLESILETLDAVIATRSRYETAK